MFSIGRVKQMTPEERRRKRKEKHRLVQSKKLIVRIPKPKPVEKWKDFHSYKRWNLLPIEMFQHKGIYFSMMFEYKTFASRYLHFQTYGHFYLKHHSFPNAPSFVNIFTKIQEEAREKYMLNQKLRWAFKRLTNAYLQKKLQLKNEVDPISLETPKKSIYIYDYQTRSKFLFEAQHLLRDFQTRLLTHEELFPTPLYLRNPLTNTKLSLGQLIHIVGQIKHHGLSHWTIECYLDSRYAMNIFLRDNNRKLRLHALKETLQSKYATEIILDFIEMQHHIYKKDFDERTYRWALENNKCHSMERIRSWKNLTFRFYELDITNEDFTERNALWNKNTSLILNLCSPCLELLEVRRTLRLNKNRSS